MIAKFVAFVTVLVTFVHGDFVNEVCRSNRGVSWKPHPVDCTTFYLCFNDQPFKYNCPIGSVRDLISKACVPEGSEADQCTKKVQDDVICEFSETKKAIPGESCAKYVDCDLFRSANGQSVNAIKECVYPMVFDEDTKRCEHPDTAECGTRHVPKDPCEYDANHCGGPHCTPCYVRFPSCVGFADGMNPWKGREKSPYYVICKNERVLFQSECPKGKDFIQVFDPDQKMCVDYTKLNRD